MILPQTLTDVLDTEATDLEDSDDEKQEFEYVADSDNNCSGED
jgi:hypothetical protein